MLVDGERWLAGSISGGCLERDVLAKGFWRTREQPAVMVSYDSDDALDERVGSGCQGVIDVLVQRHDPHATSDVFRVAERCVREESCACVLHVVSSTRPELPVGALLVRTHEQATSSDRSGWLQRNFGAIAACALAQPVPPYTVVHAGVEVLVECIAPPPHLFVFGAGHDVTPLVSLAKQLGWSVSVWDALPRTETRERFLLADHYLVCSLAEAMQRLDRCVRPAAVVMSHHLAHDRAALAALLASQVRYLGVLGARRRTEQMLADIRETGVVLQDHGLHRLHAPVGLQLGAQTPAEIALAIIAEAQATLAQVPHVASLRSQAGAIHAPVDARSSVMHAFTF
jgi:xanthine/CO dehydrogenase XdhC/CoxF family maturation factor